MTFYKIIFRLKKTILDLLSQKWYQSFKKSRIIYKATREVYSSSVSSHVAFLIILYQVSCNAFTPYQNKQFPIQLF